MKIFTKEWHELNDFMIAAEVFEPVPDMDYSDEKFNNLYQTMLDKYLNEERELYEEPFNEDEEKEFFEEQFQDALEEPDTDIPAWIRESVDPRLIALNVLPESVFKKLQEEIKEKTPRYEELENRVDDYYDSQDDEDDNPERERIDEVLCDLECEELISAAEKDSDYIIEIATWDDDGEKQIEKHAVFSNVEILEDEKPIIETGKDEDGDLVSNYFIRDYELYEAGDKHEVHLLFTSQDNENKYVTLQCDDIFFE